MEALRNLLSGVWSNLVYDYIKPLLRRKRTRGVALIGLILTTLLISNHEWLKQTLNHASNWGSLDEHEVEIKLAVFMDTGTEGTAIKNGVRIALADYASKLKRAGIKASVMDQEFSFPAYPAELRKMAAALTEDRAVIGIVGPMNSDVTGVIAPVFGKADIVIVAPFNTKPSVTESAEFQNVTRVNYNDRTQASVAASYAMQQLGAKRIAVVWFKDAPRLSYLAESFVREVSIRGIPIVNGFGYGQPIDFRDNDWTSALQPILANKPDIIYCSFAFVRAKEASIFFRQARAMGFTGTFMSSDEMNEHSSITVYAGDATQGMYFTSYGAELRSEAGEHFRLAYLSAHLEEPPILAAYGYDTARVLLEGILQGSNGRTPVTRQEVLWAVRQTKDVHGLTGEISFDTNGDNSMAPVYVYRYDGNNVTKVERVVLPQGSGPS